MPSWKWYDFHRNLGRMMNRIHPSILYPVSKRFPNPKAEWLSVVALYKFLDGCYREPVKYSMGCLKSLYIWLKLEHESKVRWFHSLTVSNWLWRLRMLVNFYCLTSIQFLTSMCTHHTIRHILWNYVKTGKLRHPKVHLGWLPNT